MICSVPLKIMEIMSNGIFRNSVFSESLTLIVGQIKKLNKVNSRRFILVLHLNSAAFKNVPVF